MKYKNKLVLYGLYVLAIALFALVSISVVSISSLPTIHAQPIDGNTGQSGIFLPFVSNGSIGQEQEPAINVDSVVDPPLVQDIDEPTPAENHMEADMGLENEWNEARPSPYHFAGAATGVTAAAGPFMTSQCSNKHIYAIGGNNTVISEHAYDGALLNATFATVSTRSSELITGYDGMAAIRQNNPLLYDSDTGNIIQNGEILQTVRWSQNGGPVTGMAGFAADEEGLYFYDADDGRIWTFQWEKTYTFNWSTGSAHIWRAEMGVARDRSGNPLLGYDGLATNGKVFYLYDDQSGGIHELDLTGRLEQANAYYMPAGLDGLGMETSFHGYNATDATHTVYWTSSGTPRRVNTLRSTDAASVYQNVAGIARNDTATYIYRADEGRIYTINADGVVGGNVAISNQSGVLRNWTDVATDGWSYYAYNRADGRVEQVNLRGGWVRTLAINLPNYEGFAADGAYLYFYNAEDGQVRQTDLRGNTIQAVYATLPTNRSGIAIDLNIRCQPGPNLAVGRTAIQSSDYADISTASSAVDGNINGNYPDGSVTHTKNDPAPWWQVDLNNPFTLDQLRIWNRTDGASERLKNFHIFVSNRDMSQRSLADLLADNSVWHHHETGTVRVEYNLALNSTGRYVRIQKANAGYLQLAEVQLFGKNLALGKTATQSETTDGQAASNAIDGDLTTHNVAGGYNAWLQVDLNQQMRLGHIGLAQNGNSPDFHPYAIFVSNSNMSARSYYELLTDPAVWKYTGTTRNSGQNVRIDATGRYLRLEYIHNPPIMLDELMIYGAENATTNDRAMAPHLYGQWAALKEWPTTGVHASLLADGTLLTYDYPSVTFDSDPHTYDNLRTRAYVWDYRTDEFSDAFPYTDTNLFCSGHASLPNGQFFATGGNFDVSWGTTANNIFDPIADEWERSPNMSYARWYPTVTPLANGEMLITGGRGNGVEAYDYRTERHRTLSEANNHPNFAGIFYPMIQQASDGQVFNGGPSVYKERLDTAGEGTVTRVGVRDSAHRGYGSYGVYDTDKMVVAGGAAGDGIPPVDTTIILNMLTGQSTDSGRLNFNRTQHNLTILPDGTLLTTGGNNGRNFCNREAPITAGELWSPDTGQWEIMSSMRQAREYHSTALLLPDARVIAMGGQNGCVQHQSADIFSPPYLFNQDGSLAARPVIASAPDGTTYNTSFQATVTGANNIDSASLVRLSSVTHSTNMEQRRIALNVSQNGNVVTLSGITGPTIAQPGYYMLFVVNSNGVPSVAHMLQVGGVDPSTATTQFNFDFGTATSPVQNGWTRVTPDTNDNVISWSGAALDSRDRGSGGGVNQINRDFVFSAGTATLNLNIGSGTWRVTMNMGDLSNVHDRMMVRAEGKTITRNVSNQAGEFPYVKENGGANSFDVIVHDGVLNFDFSDDGGTDPNWVLTRLSVTKISDSTKPPLQDEYNFDFGRRVSPVADGWIQVTPYTDNGIVQWTGTGIVSRDRGIENIDGMSDVNRDYVAGTDVGKINFNVGNGVWRVSINIGDGKFARGPQSLTVEGELITDNIMSGVKEFPYISRSGASLTPSSFDVVVTDGVLNLETAALKAPENFWTLNRLSLKKISAEPPVQNQDRYDFDFGTPSSPLQSGWTQVTPTTNSGVVKWSGANRNSVDRGQIAGNAINRDLVYGGGNSTLNLNIGNGTWRVTMNMGDHCCYRGGIGVIAEGETINSNISINAGASVYVGRDVANTTPRSFDVTVTDGVLNLDFSKGESAWVINRLSLEKVATPPPPPVQNRYDFDFGTSSSPLQSGWTQVTPNTDSGVVKWSGANRNSVDRGQIAGNAINRDLVYGSSNSTLNLNIGNGTWRVTMNMGDHCCYRGGMGVIAEEETINSNISVGADKFVYVGRGVADSTPRSFDVSVTDGVLNLSFRKGQSAWVINRLTLVRQ